MKQMAHLELPAELNIYTASELHGRWLAWLGDLPADEADARLNAAHVEQIDGAGMQLLVALQRTLAARGCAMRLIEPSQVLCDASAALGLSEWLEAVRAATSQEVA